MLKQNSRWMNNRWWNRSSFSTIGTLMLALTIGVTSVILSLLATVAPTKYSKPYVPAPGPASESEPVSRSPRSSPPRKMQELHARAEPEFPRNEHRSAGKAAPQTSRGRLHNRRRFAGPAICNAARVTRSRIHSQNRTARRSDRPRAFTRGTAVVAACAAAGTSPALTGQGEKSCTA